MPRINLQQLAERITMREGKNVNLTIAQVKEVQRYLLLELAYIDPVDLLTTLKEIKTRNEKA